MRKFVQYIADDGRAFENEDECLKYEREKANQSLGNKFRMFDPLFRETTDIHCVWYVYMYDSEAYTHFVELCDEIGVIPPSFIDKRPTKIYWDKDTEEWKDFDTLFTECLQMSRLFSQCEEQILW